MVQIGSQISEGATRQGQAMEEEGMTGDQTLVGLTNDIVAALAILDRAPDVRPDPGDDIL